MDSYNMPKRFLYILVICLMFLATPMVAHAQESSETQAKAELPVLKWVEISLAGRVVRVNSGGVMSLHPDTPFKYLEAKTDSWFNFGLSAWLPSYPNVDISQYNSLADILGEAAMSTEYVDLQVLKNNAPVGAIRLILRFLPIDWVRKAKAAAKPEQKIAYISKALELSPEDPLLTQTLLDLLLEAHKYDQAVKLLEARLAKAYSLEDARLLADIFLKTEQPKRAAATLSKLSARLPRDSALLNQLAELYLKQESLEEALAAYRRLAGLKKGVAKAKVLITQAEILRRLNKKDEMLTALEQAAGLAPADPAIWAWLAEALSAAEENDKALQALKKAVALNPGDNGLRWSLAETLLARESFNDALVQLESLAALPNPDPRVWIKLAEVYQAQDRRDQLPKVYEQLKKINPEDADLAYNLGLLRFEQEEYDAALENLLIAKKLRPKDMATGKLVFEAYCALQMWEKALAEAEFIIAGEPPSPESTALFTRCLKAEKPDYLKPLLELIIKKKPSFFLPYELKAALALDDGATDTAIQALESAHQAMPKDIGILSQLALLLESQNRDQEAMDAYASILDLDPDHAKAGEKYLMLKTKVLDRKESQTLPEPDDPTLDEIAP